MASKADERDIPEGADTRTRLVRTAMRLFQEQGFTATGIAGILREADVRSGSLYHFFATKEDLLLAVLDMYEELLWPIVLDPVFARIDDPLERVFGILDGYRSMLVETGCALGCPIGNLALEMSDAHPAVREKIAANFSGWCRGVRLCLDEIAERLPAGLDRDRMASFVLCVMEGGVMLARAHRSLEPFDSAVQYLRDYFDRLLDERRRSDGAAGRDARPDRQGMKE